MIKDAPDDFYNNILTHIMIIILLLFKNMVSYIKIIEYGEQYKD